MAPQVADNPYADLIPNQEPVSQDANPYADLIPRNKSSQPPTPQTTKQKFSISGPTVGAAFGASMSQPGLPARPDTGEQDSRAAARQRMQSAEKRVGEIDKQIEAAKRSQVELGRPSPSLAGLVQSRQKAWNERQFWYGEMKKTPAPHTGEQTRIRSQKRIDTREELGIAKSDFWDVLGGYDIAGALKDQPGAFGHIGGTETMAKAKDAARSVIESRIEAFNSGNQGYDEDAEAARSDFANFMHGIGEGAVRAGSNPANLVDLVGIGESLFDAVKFSGEYATPAVFFLKHKTTPAEFGGRLANALMWGAGAKGSLEGKFAATKAKLVEAGIPEAIVEAHTNEIHNFLNKQVEFVDKPGPKVSTEPNLKVQSGTSKVQEPASEAGGSTKATGLANQVQSREAVAGIVDEVASTKGKGASEWQQRGKKLVDDADTLDSDYEGLAHRIAHGEIELTGDRVGILLEGKRRLLNEVNSAAKFVDENPSDKAGIQRYELAKDKLQSYVENVQQGKGRWSDVGRALQAGTTLDEGNFASVLSEAKRGGSVGRMAEGALKKASEQVAERDQRIADLEAKLTDVNADRAFQRAARQARTNRTVGNIRARRADLVSKLRAGKPSMRSRERGAANFSPEDAWTVAQIAKTYIEEGITRFDDVVQKVSEDLEWKVEDVRAALASRITNVRTKNELNEQLSALRNRAKTEAGLESKIADLQEQLQTGEYKEAIKKTTFDDARLSKLRSERDLLAADVRARIRAAKTPAWHKAVSEITGGIRGTVLGSDVGVLTRQGLFAWPRLLRGDLTPVKAVGKALGSAFSENALAKFERGMVERPEYITGKKAGLQLTGQTLNAHEELIVGRLLRRIPIAGKLVGGALERFQTTFINSVRQEVFDQAVRAGFSETELASRARFINNMTGRGNLKNVKEGWNILMTSPRYEASRWALIGDYVTSPLTALKAVVKGDKAAAAKIVDLGAAAATIYGLYKLAELNGYTISFDRSSADFLKMRKGDEVWDPWAGLAQRARTGIAIVMAWFDPKYGETVKDEAGKAIMRTISPGVKIVAEETSKAYQRQHGHKKPKSPLTGYSSEGDSEGLWVIAPLIIQGMQQALKKDGWEAAVSTGAREFIGQSVQRYKKPKKH